MILSNLNLNLHPFPIFSAPLCGYTRYPFRKILSRFSYDLIFTEMVSATALYYKSQETESIYATFDEEKPLGVQLFGSQIDHFLFAIEKLSALNQFVVFDINCGCPVPKVLKTGGGSALLKTPDHLYNMFKAFTSQFPHLHFSAKIRLGTNLQTLTYREVAHSLEEGGAELITVHGRTQNQYYTGEINYEAIKEIKDHSQIPIIGNGNIFTPQDAKKMIELTGCDGIMLARGLIGNPFLVDEIREYMATGNYISLGIKEKLDILQEHLTLENKINPINGYKEFKKSALAYLKGIPYAKEYKAKISTADSSEKMTQIIVDLCTTLMENEMNPHE